MAQFFCSKCDAQYVKWQGRCSECDGWGTIVQPEPVTTAGQSRITAKPAELQPLSAVTQDQVERFAVGIKGVDRVFGGGLVAGSLVLLGGEPGIGKSTILLQFAESSLMAGMDVAYFSGEESVSQIKTRAERLGMKLGALQTATVTNCDTICARLAQDKPAVAIVDSIQTMWTSAADGVAGGIAQVRACTAQLLEQAKKHTITIIIVGHVTKEGQVAGPKTLEHLVDVVVQLEGERLDAVRLLRAVKNRFGPAGELAVLTMTKQGLQPIQDAAQVFLSKHISAPGLAVGAAVDGLRVFLVDVQALVAKTASSYPKRVATGFDTSRLNMLLAILQSQIGITFHEHDVYVSLPGGLKSKDPNLDVAICCALVSARVKLPLPEKTVLVGEVGLSGNLRAGGRYDTISREAASLGFTNIIIPELSKVLTSSKIHIAHCATLAQVVQKFFPKKGKKT